jgi:hypothetical protein
VSDAKSETRFAASRAAVTVRLYSLGIFLAPDHRGGDICGGGDKSLSCHVVAVEGVFTALKQEI